MERMWRKVNQGLSGKSSKQQHHSHNNTLNPSTDTASSAGFGDPQIVVAVQGQGCGGGLTSGSCTINNTLNSNTTNNSIPPNLLIGTNSSITGRRLAASGQQCNTIVSSNSFSQHVISTASSERRRKRRRKSRPRRNGESRSGILKTSQPFQISCGGGGGSSGVSDQPQNSSTAINSQQIQGVTITTTTTTTTVTGNGSGGGGGCGGSGSGDPSLRQRAVAKLRMFNFHLNWDLHMTQCKPCGPRSSGNILTRRLCRNRRRDDNELYRSNSFKFERFERKEGNSEQATDTLQKQISVCDDYSLPIDFVKKRPSSFDPCLAETIPDNWAAPSPLSEHVSFLDPPTIIHPIQTQPVKIVEGYSDPKDSRKLIKIHHRKSRKDKRSNYDSDSSAPKSSADEDNQSIKVPELNSPDSISEDLIRPLQSHKSPKKLTTGPPDTCKRNPSPYYYSDLLKPKDPEQQHQKHQQHNKDKKSRLRQSTASEPPQLFTTSSSLSGIPPPQYKKSVSLDVPEIERELQHQQQQQHLQPKRYSITEDGVRIIRCNSPSTTTSDDSDCSECQKRREWHAKALALVRQTCNIAGIHYHQQIGINQQQQQQQQQQHQQHPLPIGVRVSGVTGLEPVGIGFIGSCGIGNNIDSHQQNNTSMPPHRILGPAVCACAAPAVGDDIDEFFRPRSIFYVHQQGAHECADCSIATTTNLGSDKSNNTTIDLQDDDMSSGSRRRQIYETAFDCKVAPSDDDLDDVDRITNHSVLLQITNNGNNVNNQQQQQQQQQQQSHGNERNRSSSKSGNRIEVKRLKNSKNQAIQDGSVSTLSQELESVHLENNLDNINNANTTSQLPTRGYTPSPPSTAPLPVKFPGKHDRFFMNSIKSAPNLPSSNPAHPRLKDLRLPIQSSIRHQQHEVPTGSDGSTLDTSYNPPPRSSHRRDRPRSVVLESGRVLELRKSHHHGRSGHNYSSTESMATSSSGGSMESLRSSTSEGNRSTTSSESRHSTSLSSHSSDSGHSMAFPIRAPVALHAKLHILSPISDKSSQEPASETSEVNNRNNNSQKVSPDDTIHKIQSGTGTNHPSEEQTTASVTTTMDASQQKQQKRRTLPNKILLHLTDEMLGSDSGISLHSRGEDGKSHQSAFHKFTLPKLSFPPENIDCNVISTSGLPQDLRDLPFDMPKLRRRKVLLQQDVCTSGSATSVDLGDLPFDMPKLRRRLRQPQTTLLIHSAESSGISQASSSHSVRDENKPGVVGEPGLYRQNLTLNLNEAKPAAKFGSLDLKGASSKGLNLNLVASGFGSSAVDLIDVTVPLERQGWYHGAITRIEAESTLRPLTEGSFLVRNCESTKQDYSLSLKSAKGFMHMRIQRNDSGQYILGQFSRPFESIPEMIKHFCLNRLPVRGAEHMCLLDPVIAQLL